ncbi:hypothetical protein V8F20_010646 [Naviculisporaceae sp. PSN 640]
MKFSIKHVASLLASPLGALATGTNGCSHNNCLRAVIAEAFTTRDGRGDCSKYLRVTVTPATSTFVSTVTEPALVVVSTTIIESYTDTQTIVASTETQYAQETAVIEEIQTITETAFTTRTIDPDGNPYKLKRQVTAFGSTFPGYASPCTSFAKYTSACSCVGVFPETITVSAPSTTITVTSTSTSTSTYTETTSTTTTSPLSITDTTLLTSTLTITFTISTTTTTSTSTSTATNIVKNGRFSQGLAHWTITSSSQVSASVSNLDLPGETSNRVLKTSNMINNNLFEMRQTLLGIPGQLYTCQYDWFFANHYETRYSNGNIYVPYVHIYINDDFWDNSTPQPPRSPGVWYTTRFDFVSSGSDILWFDCASPQARNGPGGGSNYLMLDNISCFAVE